ncbi:MAG: HAMP domain-containing histidine kinase [Actinobacteria bacterium]|nr:HAMP domain-containing histidine kinase [Actinomycetota bacterium]
MTEPSAPTTGIPPAARVFIAAVSVLGVLAVALAVTRAGDLTSGDLLAVVLVAAAVVVADRFTFQLPHGDETEHVMLSDAVWTTALLLTVPGVPTLGAVLGTAAWQVAARWPLRKIAFNVGQVAIALTVAEAVFGLGGTGRDPLDPVTWAFGAGAMALASVLNVGLVGVVISLVQAEPLRVVLFGPWRLTNIQWVGNVSVGLLAAVLWNVSPYGVVLLALPIVLLSLAYRDWVRSTIEANQMEQMMKGAEAIARERAFEARLPVGEGGGRLPELAVALNHMLDQLELALHRQRQLMADVAGRLRRPIGAISSAVDRRQQNGAGHNGTAHATGEISEETRADLRLVSRILDDMADIGRSQTPGYVDRKEVPLAELVANVATKAEPFLGGRLHATAPETATVAALDQDRMEEALLRLLQNTADHGSGARPVNFRAVEEDRSILFEVVDEGGGVPAGHEEIIFEPFYRADARRDGGGLGLALVRTVAEAHGGSAGIVNRPGAGVTFWVRVPR